MGDEEKNRLGTAGDDGVRGDLTASEGGTSAKNGSVGRVEGSHEAVMLENEYVGGSDETALKTAPGAAREENTAGEEETAGARGDAAPGDSITVGRGITEAQARAMLIEDNQRAKAEAKKDGGRRRKVLVAVIVLAVLLIGIGVAASVILGGMRKSDGEGSGNGDKQEGNGGNSAMVEKPEEKPEEGPVELSLDDELVQRIYGNFSVIPALFDGWWEFYVDEGVKKGEISREHMLRLAGANLWNSPCTGDYEYANGGKVENECASGEAVRAKIEEMFGERLELTADDKLRSFCGGMIYEVANDEFFQTGNGCGGTSPISMERVLMKAERKGDEIVLYEKVLMFNGMAYYTVGETEIVRQAGEYELEVAGEKIGEYTVPEDVLDRGSEFYRAWLAENTANLAKEYGTLFKWTFEKNGEGNYVFRGLERVTEGEDGEEIVKTIEEREKKIEEEKNA